MTNSQYSILYFYSRRLLSWHCTKASHFSASKRLLLNMQCVLFFFKFIHREPLHSLIITVWRSDTTRPYVPAARGPLEARNYRLDSGLARRVQLLGHAPSGRKQKKNSARYVGYVNISERGPSPAPPAAARRRGRVISGKEGQRSRCGNR